MEKEVIDYNNSLINIDCFTKEIILKIGEVITIQNDKIYVFINEGYNNPSSITHFYRNDAITIMLKHFRFGILEITNLCFLEKYEVTGDKYRLLYHEKLDIPEIALLKFYALIGGLQNNKGK